MQLNQLDIFRAGKQKMRYLSERQAVLAMNIANADTEGYHARDLQTPDFASMVSPATSTIKLERTNIAHLEGANTGGLFKVVSRDPSSERNPNDNEVNIDEEVQKVATTQLDYNKVVSIYRKNISLYKMALGNPNAQ